MQNMLGQSSTRLFKGQLLFPKVIFEGENLSLKRHYMESKSQQVECKILQGIKT